VLPLGGITIGWKESPFFAGEEKHGGQGSAMLRPSQRVRAPIAGEKISQAGGGGEDLAVTTTHGRGRNRENRFLSSGGVARGGRERSIGSGEGFGEKKKAEIIPEEKDAKGVGKIGILFLNKLGREKENPIHRQANLST